MDELPHMSIDPTRPGVIILDDSPFSAILAGPCRAAIVRACNASAALETALGNLVVAFLVVSNDIDHPDYRTAINLLAKLQRERNPDDAVSHSPRDRTVVERVTTVLQADPLAAYQVRIEHERERCAELARRNAPTGWQRI
jgi:hypothetical protein